MSFSLPCHESALSRAILPKLECKHCGHRQFAGSHADEREFTTLQVYCADRNTHVCFDDLQSAMSASFDEELDNKYRAVCHCGERWSLKRMEVEKPPEVLLIQLLRWRSMLNDSGTAVLSRQPSTMRINEQLDLVSSKFLLHGIILHQGASPNSGHYIAVVRHGDSAEPFFCYNDGIVQHFPRAHIACDVGRSFHVTALLYERAS